MKLKRYQLIILLLAILTSFIFFYFSSNSDGPYRSGCSFNAEIDCLEVTIHSLGPNEGGQVHFRFRNNMKKAANFNVTMIYGNNDNPFADSCVIELNKDELDEIASGEKREVVCTFKPGIDLPVEDLVKFQVIFNVRTLGSSEWKKVNGAIMGYVN